MDADGKQLTGKGGAVLRGLKRDDRAKSRMPVYKLNLWEINVKLYMLECTRSLTFTRARYSWQTSKWTTGWQTKGLAVTLENVVSLSFLSQYTELAVLNELSHHYILKLETHVRNESYSASIYVRCSLNRACALTNNLVRLCSILYDIIKMTALWESVIVIFLTQQNTSNSISKCFIV